MRWCSLCVPEQRSEISGLNVKFKCWRSVRLIEVLRLSRIDRVVIAINERVIIFDAFARVVLYSGTVARTITSDTTAGARGLSTRAVVKPLSAVARHHGLRATMPDQSLD